MRGPPTTDSPGDKPTLAWLPVDRLDFDAAYQRDAASARSRRIIDKIAAEFRWARFGAVLVVPQAGAGDDRYAVVDGQHRITAARARGIHEVPAVVLPGASVAEAAADFVAVNRDRTVVTPMQIHFANLAAGDPRAIEIQEVCAAAGVTLCRYSVGRNEMKPGHTMAIGTIDRLVADKGAAFARRVLALMVHAYAGKPNNLNAAFIRAVGRCLALANGPAEEAIADVLRSVPQYKLLGEADTIRLNAGGDTATHLVAVICRRARGAGKPGQTALLPRRTG